MDDDLREDPKLRASQDDPLVALFVRTGFAENVRYDHMRNQWYYWQSPRWHADRTKAIFDLVRLHANYLFNSSGENDGEMRKMLLPLFNFSKKEAFLKTLSVRPEVSMRGNEWDMDPYLLGFDNGVMDLRTGEFDRNPPRENLISRSVGCDWDPKAGHEEFDKFLVSIFPDEPEVLQYVATMLGYSLFGLQTEQKFWMWVGRGSNGKGVLARAVGHALGNYAEFPSDTMYMRTKFGSTQSSAARPDLVRLQGVRFTPISEPPGKQFNEELVKAHTGDDVIIARDLYGRAQEMTQFNPTHKIVFLTNDPPRTDDVGVSMRRRAKYVFFNQDFTGLPGSAGPPNMRLDEQLKAEKQGILVRLVQWAQFWYQHGLDEPAKVTEWSDEYIASNDPLGRWVQDDCLMGGTGRSAVLYGDYQDWCARNTEEPISQTAFGIAMSKRFRKARTGTGVLYHGITLKPIEDRAGE